MIGIRPAHGAADSSMLSAIRFVAERHGERVRKNKAETIVPPLANAIHQTYSRIANAQATGIATPQTPMPLTKSHPICTSSAMNRRKEHPKPIHHQRGARSIRTRLLTSSLSEVRVTSGPTTGASAGSSLCRVVDIDHPSTVRVDCL